MQSIATIVSVCLYVDCLSARLSQKPHVQTELHEISASVTYIHCDSILLLRRRIMSCIPGFADAAMFTDN